MKSVPTLDFRVWNLCQNCFQLANQESRLMPANCKLFTIQKVSLIRTLKYINYKTNEIVLLSEENRSKICNTKNCLSIKSEPQLKIIDKTIDLGLSNIFLVILLQDLNGVQFLVFYIFYVTYVFPLFDFFKQTQMVHFLLGKLSDCCKSLVILYPV